MVEDESRWEGGREREEDRETETELAVKDRGIQWQTQGDGYSGKDRELEKETNKDRQNEQ